MAEFQTGYQALGSFYDDDDDQEEEIPAENIIHVVPDRNKARWNHVEDLDAFFTRVYHYHQRAGFTCMVVQDLLQLVQFSFVVLFSTFLMECVDYDILFYEIPRNTSGKVTLPDAVYTLDQCINKFDAFLIFILIVALLLFVFRLLKIIYNFGQYWEMRTFYTQALKVTSNDLCNMTWHEVQQRLVEVQKEQQMCIHKQELTSLDIYHRILRFKNYMVAMVNKSMLPLQYKVPLIGEYAFLPTSLKYNLEMILFWGPWSPFENNWHLKPEYRNYHKRKDLAKHLSSRILWIGIANFILCPLIFLWQILYSFFRYADEIKREPGFLGSRRWSLYSRLYLRHFNELDHEFNSRLNRSYRFADKYMGIFTSPLLVVVAKHIAFFAGALLAVLIILTAVDGDFLDVQHVVGSIALLTLVVAICRSCIPDEHLVFCPELLMRDVLARIHYMPDNWKGNAHTYWVKDQFAQLFQYKCVFLVEELLSPIITPILLCFFIRHKSQEIVDFFRNFTVDVTGVGDVCSFAQMDVKKHGNPQWVAESQTQANQYQQAEDGKTELSLMHFTLTNPEWKPPQVSNMFMNNLREQAQRDANTIHLPTLDNPLVSSLYSMSSMGYGPSSGNPFPSMVQPNPLAASSAGQHRSSAPVTPAGLHSPSVSGSRPQLGSPGVIRGGLRNTEGPLGGSANGLLASIQQGPPLSTLQPVPGFNPSTCSRPINEETLELLSTEMNFGALYMHELHQRRLQLPYGSQGDEWEEQRAHILWQVPEDDVRSQATVDLPDAGQDASTSALGGTSTVSAPESPLASGSENLRNLLASSPVEGGSAQQIQVQDAPMPDSITDSETEPLMSGADSQQYKPS